MAHRDHPEGPWQQQDGLEMVVYWILFEFGVIVGAVYISFLSSRTLKFENSFLSGLFPDHFLSISESEFQRLGLPNQGVRMESIAKIDFPRKSFLMNFEVEFLVVSQP